MRRLILGASGCRAELDAVAVLGSMQPQILDYQPVNDNYLQVLSILNLPFSCSPFSCLQQLTAKLPSLKSPYAAASCCPVSFADIQC